MSHPYYAHAFAHADASPMYDPNRPILDYVTITGPDGEVETWVVDRSAPLNQLSMTVTVPLWLLEVVTRDARHDTH